MLTPNDKELRGATEHPNLRHRFEAWRRWILRLVAYAAVGAALGLGAAFCHYLAIPPQYEARSLVFVVPTRADQRDFSSLNQIRWSQALARLAPSPEVSGHELQAAGLADIAADPQMFVSTSAAPDASVFSVTVRHSDPDEAMRAATLIADATRTLCTERGLPVTASVVPATRPEAAGPRLFTRLVLGGSAGVGAGCLLFLIRLDRRDAPAVDKDDLPDLGG